MMEYVDPVRMLSASTITITGVLFLATFSLYRWLLPKPIPGIPFNPEATNSIFGDIPSMLNHLKTHKTVSDWVLNHSTRHNSPIVQVFANLFGKQWVIINDYREAQDILMRRTKEFDKPDLLSDIFWGLSPDHHLVKPSNDEFRFQRKLMQDLMSPAFLNGVAVPQVHENFLDLIKFWREKIRLSKGHPFSVKEDVYDTALEAIWAAVFGIEETATITRNQIDLLSRMEQTTLSPMADEEATFPRAPAPAAFDAILRLADSFELLVKSPFPRAQGFIMRYMPSIRRNLKLKDEVIINQISKAEKRLADSKDKEEKFATAVDHMLRREAIAAERQKRAPDYQSKVMIAELFGLLLAGHDTTSTTLLWAIKLLAANQNIQQKLRSELRIAFAAAHSQARVPNAQEIATTQNHYLDACLEEIIRCSRTATIPSRRATQDAVVLGHVIPKGTSVLFMATGGGILQPNYKIDDKLRSQSYRNADGGKVGVWNSEDIEEFKPERWLVHNKDTGATVFDSQAGPHLTFGLGPRSCFGRKLAYLELRLGIVLILWSFKLQPVPEKYASWEAIDQLTHAPVQAYVQLAEA